jgi:DNA-binding LytR/AlgR family response regulator
VGYYLILQRNLPHNPQNRYNTMNIEKFFLNEAHPDDGGVGTIPLPSNEVMKLEQAQHRPTEAFYPIKIFVNMGKKLAGVNVADIAYCKASRDYTVIFTATGERFLSSKGIGYLEQSFDPRYFLRVHRSYIINLRHVALMNTELSKYYFVINDECIPVSRQYLPLIKQLIF